MTVSTGPVQDVTLKNGLRIRLKEIHTAPLISSWIWYRVGSRNEIQGITGISHWVEHMQFKGTPRYPAGILDRAISRSGGIWNALTYLDWTCYFETMPSDQIDLALDLEADRMVNSLYDPQEVASERTVIISERQGHENEPYYRLGEEVQAAAFRVHSYHHEVIGDQIDLERMTRDDLYQHYRRYYVPGNAILVVAGDFQTSEMLDLIQEKFSGIPCAEVQNFQTRPEPVQKGERRVYVEGPGDTSFLEVGYHAPAGSDPDFIPMMVLDSVLCGPSSLNLFGGGISNRTSRLYQALVKGELAAGVGGSLSATIDPFLYSIQATIRQDKTAGDTLVALDTEIERVLNNPLKMDEINKAIRQAQALFAYGSESITNQAFWMGYSEIFADYSWFTGYLDRIEAVTPEQVLITARKILRPQNRTVGIYQSQDEVPA
ncbi:MAG: insulinase family protein [Anaerolineales bacterium]|nr:insulinase family protein [Anaerolineales bacterium]